MGSPQAAAPTTELGRHRWRVLLLSSIAMFVGTMLTTIVAVALPKISWGEDPIVYLTYSESLWVQAIFPVMMSVCMVPVGRLADRYGYARFYVLGLSIFGLFSIGCASAFNATFLIVSRCLQGLGGGMMATTAMALVTVSFPPEERGKGLGFNAMAGYLGLVIGPALGGVIVQHISWRWIYLVGLPLILLTIVASWHMMGAERRDREAARGHDSTPTTRLDWVGTALLGLTMASLLVPLISVPFWGWTDARTLGLLGAFALLLTTFILVELRVKDPVLDLNMVRKNRVFAAGTIAALLNYAAVFGLTTFTALFLQLVEGYDPAHAGLVLLTTPIFIVGLSAFFGSLSDRIGQRIPATGGMLLAAAGTAQLGLLPSPAPLWRIILGLVFVGLGMAAFSSPNTSSVMGAVGRTDLSLASGFLGTMRTAGQGLSIGLLGAIAASSMGPEGGAVLYGGAEASITAAANYADGYRAAMLAAAGLAVIGALVSMVRGPRTDQTSPT